MVWLQYFDYKNYYVFRTFTTVGSTGLPLQPTVYFGVAYHSFCKYCIVTITVGYLRFFFLRILALPYIFVPYTSQYLNCNININININTSTKQQAYIYVKKRCVFRIPLSGNYHANISNIALKKQSWVSCGNLRCVNFTTYLTWCW